MEKQRKQKNVDDAARLLEEYQGDYRRKRKRTLFLPANLLVEKALKLLKS
jgi:hypothetical protein